MRLELDSGSRIVAPAGEPGETVRGFSRGAPAREDEAARTPEDAYAAARPMLDPDHGGSLALDAVWRKRTFLRGVRDPGTWQVFEVPAERVPRLSPDSCERPSEP